jgi:hypothetical protein
VLSINPMYDLNLSSNELDIPKQSYIQLYLDITCILHEHDILYIFIAVCNFVQFIIFVYNCLKLYYSAQVYATVYNCLVLYTVLYCCLLLYFTVFYCLLLSSTVYYCLLLSTNVYYYLLLSTTV